MSTPPPARPPAQPLQELPRISSAKQQAAEKIARDILRLAREGEPRLEVVDPREFPAAQQAHADRTGAGLARHGFAHLADVEALHLRPVTGEPVLLRVHAERGASSATVAASYRMEPRLTGLERALLRLLRQYVVVEAVELKTTFADGTGVFTAAVGRGPTYFQNPPEHDALALAIGPDVDVVVRTHADRVAAHQAARPGVDVVPVPDLGAVQQLWAREVAARTRFREEIGFVTDDELGRMLGRHVATVGPWVRYHLRRFVREGLPAEA